MNLPVVVGVDGSPLAAEAAGRGAPLHVVHANYWPTVRMPAGHYPIEFQQPLLEHSKRLLDDAVADVRRRRPELTVTSALVTTTAADLLIAESRHAQLVVLGARGLGGFAELLAGAVPVAVANHAHCPV